VTVVDPRTIRFDFKRVNPELPLIVGGMPVFSRQWGQVDGQTKPFDKIVTDMPIGSGPYKIGRVVFGRDVSYERDNNYWARDLNVRKGLFNFDRITYRLYKDSTAQVEGFKAGEFDLMQSFIAREWARSFTGKQFANRQLMKSEFKHGNAGDFQGFMFNTRLPKFKDARVREAIGLAMDYEWMNRQLFYGAYQRVRGYFVASDFEATGVPDAPELAFEVAPLLATRLFAAIELGRRVPLRRMERPRVFTPTGIARWARTQLFQHRVEEAWVVSLNSRNAVLRYDRVAQGGVSHCTIDPRDALAPAVACRAAAIVLVHSHPAGDPEPSVQDLALTRRIRAAAKLLNVVLVDHLVLTAEGYVSMLERGLLDHQAGAPLLVRQPFTDEED
jgi:hypothetical protein